MLQPGYGQNPPGQNPPPKQYTITAPEFVAKYLNTMLLQAGCFNCFCIFSNNRGDFDRGDFVLDSLQPVKFSSRVNIT